MRIVRLDVQNFKRVAAVAITPDQSVIQITGANGSGKTSVLDAIFCLLAGAKYAPEQPIREGQPKAVITADLGDYIVTRRFTPAGTVVEVTNPTGQVFKKPQEVLDGLLGALSFDPLAFSRKSAKEQGEQLRKVVTLDVDLDALDREAQRLYDERTEHNREAKRLEAQAVTLAGTFDPEADPTPVDVSAMIDQLQNAQAHNAAIAHDRDRRERAAEARAALAVQIEEIEVQIAGLREKQGALRSTLTAQLRAVELEPPLAEPIDITLLRCAVDDANRENAARAQTERNQRDHRQALSLLTAARGEAQLCTDRIAEIEVTKRDAIARANMPVVGLSFAGGELTYNGLPLAQASSGEQIRVAVAIGMALNPKLRVLTIKDGSLLDEQSLALLEQMAEAHDFQVWLERVDTSGAVGITMVDGTIAAVNGAPVAEPDALVGDGELAEV